MPRDPFDMEAGGFTSDYNATISAVNFAEGKYGFQATFTCKYDQPIAKDDGTLSVDRPEFVSIGGNDQWRAIDNGAGFVSADGDLDKRVRVNSGFGRWLERVLELVGKDQLVAEGRDAPYTESFWKGLRFHFETEGEGKDYSFKDKDTGEQKTGKTKGYTIPTEYLGASAATNGHVEEFDVNSLELPENVLGQLVSAADAADSAQEFQSKALSVALGQEDPVVKGKVTAALAEPRLYAALRG